MIGVITFCESFLPWVFAGVSPRTARASTVMEVLDVPPAGRVPIVRSHAVQVALGLPWPRSAIRVEADDAPDGTIMTVDIDHSDIRVATDVVIRNGGRVISATELVPADATR